MKFLADGRNARLECSGRLINTATLELIGIEEAGGSFLIDLHELMEQRVPEGDVAEWTSEERRELAAYMIDLWKRWAGL